MVMDMMHRHMPAPIALGMYCGLVSIIAQKLAPLLTPEKISSMPLHQPHPDPGSGAAVKPLVGVNDSLGSSRYLGNQLSRTCATMRPTPPSCASTARSSTLPSSTANLQPSRPASSICIRALGVLVNTNLCQGGGALPLDGAFAPY